MAGEDSRFWTGVVLGDAGPYGSPEFADFVKTVGGFPGAGTAANNAGPLQGSGDGTFGPLRVIATSPVGANVRIAPGSALVQGYEYVNTTYQVKAIAANSSGNPRIDTAVLQCDIVNQTIRSAIKQGTPAASPVRPTLTQSAGVFWEIPLGDIAVANAFSSISDANITNYPQFANLFSTLAYDGILNTQGAELITADLCAFDTVATGRSAKKTTTANQQVGGVWIGLTPSAGMGRMIYNGIAYVKVSAAVAVGAQLVASSTAGQARTVASGEKNVFGIALTASVGAGIVLAVINIMIAPPTFHSGASLVRSSNLALSSSVIDVPWQSKLYDTDSYIPTLPNASINIPVTGRYSFSGFMLGNSVAGGHLTCVLTVNGSTIATFDTGGDNAPISWTASLTVGDVVKLRASINGTGNVTGGMQLELLTG